MQTQFPLKQAACEESRFVGCFSLYWLVRLRGAAAEKLLTKQGNKGVQGRVEIFCPHMEPTDCISVT